MTAASLTWRPSSQAVNHAALTGDAGLALIPWPFSPAINLSVRPIANMLTKRHSLPAHLDETGM
jgi:hypothetical protein